MANAECGRDVATERRSDGGAERQRDVATERRSDGVRAALPDPLRGCVASSLPPPSVESLLADLHGGHSELQVEHFILKLSGITNYGQYMQALRELEGRKHALASMSLELETVQLDIKAAKRKHRWSWGDRRLRALIRLCQLRNAKDSTLRGLRDTLREYDLFLNAAIKFKQLVGDLGDGERERLDTAMWIEKMTRMVEVDLVTLDRPSKQTLELLISLGDDTHRAIVAAANLWLGSNGKTAKKRLNVETGEGNGETGKRQNGETGGSDGATKRLSKTGDAGDEGKTIEPPGTIDRMHCD